MILGQEIKNSLEESVLCWMATADSSGIPNVSPKEIFCAVENQIIIANIASPGTEKNLKDNPKACLSFIHILKQKGYQLKGDCEIIDHENPLWLKFASKLNELTEGHYPIKNIFLFTPGSFKPIIAPSYFVFPEQSTEDKIKAAKIIYKLDG